LFLATFEQVARNSLVVEQVIQGEAKTAAVRQSLHSSSYGAIRTGAQPFGWKLECQFVRRSRQDYSLRLYSLEPEGLNLTRNHFRQALSIPYYRLRMANAFPGLKGATYVKEGVNNPTDLGRISAPAYRCNRAAALQVINAPGDTGLRGVLPGKSPNQMLESGHGSREALEGEVPGDDQGHRVVHDHHPL
jgi:hypothetical protein